MDFVYMALIALSIYTMLDGFFDHLLDRDIEELKKRIEELEKRCKNVWANNYSKTPNLLHDSDSRNIT